MRKQLILIATISAVFTVPLLGAAQTQARSLTCSSGTLVPWDRNSPPDYNHDAKVCRIFVGDCNPLCTCIASRCFAFIDDIIVKR